MSGQIKIQEHKMQMRPARCVALVMVELQTKIREDFTFTKKAATMQGLLLVKIAYMYFHI